MSRKGLHSYNDGPSIHERGRAVHRCTRGEEGVTPTDAHDASTHKGKAKAAVDKGHGCQVWLARLLRQQRCDALVERRGALAHATHGGKHCRHERCVLHLTESLFVGLLLSLLVTDVGGREGGGLV